MFINKNMESETLKNFHLTKLDHWAVIVLLVGLCATPLWFWPFGNLSLEVIKKLLLSGTVIVSLVLWFIARLKSHRVVVPKTWLLIVAKLFCLVALVAALVSPAPMSALLGVGYETDTVFSLCVFLALAFLAGEYLGQKQTSLKVFVGTYAIFTVVFLYQVVHLIFGNFMPWSVFNGGASNLIGQWNDLGILAGLVALVSTVMLEFLPLKEAKTLNLFSWISLVISMLTLVLVNFYQLWIVLAIFALIIYVYDLSFNPRKTAGAKRFGRVSLALLVLSLAFSLFGTPLSYDAQGKTHEGFLSSQVRKASTALQIGSLDVRPSWQGTMEVTTESLKSHPLFGVGPNQFSSAWLLHKPNGVNQSQYWNLEPNFGVGIMPTFAATTGLLGALLLLALVLLLLWSGKPLLRSQLDSLNRAFLVLSFIATVYLWTMVIIYTPQTVVLMVASVMTGLFIAQLVNLGEIKTFNLALASNAQSKFVSTLTSVVAGLVLTLLAYAWLASTMSLILVQRANTAVSKGDYDQAASLLKTILWINPEGIYYRTAFQVNLMQIGKLLNQSLSQDEMAAEYSKLFAVAKNNVDQAVSANPLDYKNYVAVGNLYENIISLGIQGAYELAHQNYEKAQTYNPLGPDMYLNLARLEVTNKNYSAAEDDLNQALAQKSDYVDAITLQSQLYAARGFLDSAITRATYAVQLSPNDASLYFQLGYLQYQDANYRAAAEAMTAALKLVPNYANALYFLGLSYDKLGNRSKALDAFSTIATNNPDNQEIAQIIANLKAGRAAQAAADTEATSTDQELKTEKK